MSVFATEWCDIGCPDEQPCADFRDRGDGQGICACSHRDACHPEPVVSRAVLEREEKAAYARLGCAARDLVIIGMAQRLWQCDFGEAKDAIEALLDAEREESDGLRDEAVIAACELLLEEDAIPAPAPQPDEEGK